MCVYGGLYDVCVCMGGCMMCVCVGGLYCVCVCMGGCMMCVCVGGYYASNGPSIAKEGG